MIGLSPVTRDKKLILYCILLRPEGAVGGGKLAGRKEGGRQVVERW